MTMKTCPERGKRNLNIREECRYCGASLEDISGDEESDSTTELDLGAINFLV